MTVPTYDQLMLPLLQYAGDQSEHHIRDAIDAVGEHLQLSEQQKTELLPSGSQRKFDNRIQWAKTYLKKAGLIESTGRGLFRITNRGIQVLNADPPYLDKDYLKQFSDFVGFITPSTTEQSEQQSLSIDEESEQLTPKEQIESVYMGIRRELADELLEYVLSVSATFFEKLVIDLLLAMGYGGGLGSGAHLGRTGDGGLDGFIQEDKLGLDTIYLQAKRWAPENTVGRPDVQSFVGSLMGVGATKGVFITTSNFSQHAENYAKSIQNLKVILINGAQLAALMIEHDVGVSVEKNYTIKKVDTDYFDLG